MISKHQKKLLNDCYFALEPFNNEDWTAYRDKAFDLSLLEAKAHDHFRGGKENKRGCTLTDKARYFVVLRFTEYFFMKSFRHSEKITPPDPADYFHLQTSCYACYALAHNRRLKDIAAKIMTSSAGAFQTVASWDYVDLIATAEITAKKIKALALETTAED